MNDNMIDFPTIEQVSGIVRRASALMVRGGFDIESKGTRENIVTTSDLAVQHFLMEELGTLLPGSGFLCEEEDFVDTAHREVWVIDPIDGTANYASGIESCCISVALARDGEPVLGVVYSPWRGEMYTAVKGGGAFCNGEPISVSDRPFEDGLLFTALCVYKKELSRACSDIIYDLYMECNDVRRTGSAAVELCLVAAGKAELYFEIRLMPWDFAAASLVLREAGGVIRGFDGCLPPLFKPSLVVGANSAASCDRLMECVRRHLAELPY